MMGIEHKGTKRRKHARKVKVEKKERERHPVETDKKVKERKIKHTQQEKEREIKKQEAQQKKQKEEDREAISKIRILIQTYNMRKEGHDNLDQHHAKKEKALKAMDRALQKLEEAFGNTGKVSGFKRIRRRIL